MKRNLTLPIILLSLLIFAEIVSYLAVRNFFTENRQHLKYFNRIWWTATVLLYFFLFWGRSNIENNTFKNFFFNGFMMVLITKLFLALSFFIIFLFQFIQELLSSGRASSYIHSRRVFAGKLSLGIVSIPFASMIWGIVRTAYDFKVRRVKIENKKIPPAFKGFKVVQISDIHTGSLQNKGQLQKAMDMVMNLSPDLIVFTGDIVNNRTNEADAYKEVLAALSAPHGVFSTLGNHDYGDYHSWSSVEEKEENMQEMYRLHKEIGWQLLLNEHVKIEKQGEFFTLIGIENWGGNFNFKKYGDLKKAYHNVDKDSFQLLLSHDPSHWSHEVRLHYKEVDLTLSGHTHGFQFGVEIPGFKWSPSKYLYPQWAGLYKDQEQLLYVNRGLGCLGYMGRIGIKPEITLIEFA